MGFDQQDRRKTYELKFRPYPGLTVWCRKPGHAATEALTDAVLALGDDFAGTDLPWSERVRWWGVLFQAFADSLLRWDLFDGRVAVPVADALQQDTAFLMALTRTWFAVVVARQEDEEAASPDSADDGAMRAAVERERLLADIPVRTVELPDDQDDTPGAEAV